ncbi:HlyD family secretion protein [Rhodopirellula sp. P2]|uniref:HlyD family secretion protein n=1 Tax=Rhodopirellula sp. P2 TaxID=2127060 RepID=UPI002368446A|nr:HlyD family efflux transporter periplasmic adaptor subunit [Rhodopirellula sp. P2]WDQ18782.1 HlyD family efflux transporter periplasmic adaptor subunit [Rhodopirellula sp. P2]
MRSSQSSPRRQNVVAERSRVRSARQLLQPSRCCTPKGVAPADSVSPPRTGGIMIGLLICLILLGVGGYFGYQRYVAQKSQISIDDLIVTKTTKAAFDHTVIEQGEIESSSNTEIVCQIESRGGSGTSILWVIDEGSRVRKGDKLVELDSSNLEVELKEDRIQVITAEANVATASALVEQAKIAREEYLEGVFKTDEKTIQSEIAVAEQELRKAQLAIGSTERLVAKGLVKSLQLEADKFALANARNQLESAEARLKVLQNLTRRKMLVQFDSDIDAAEATLSAARAELLSEQQELGEVEQQIQHCVIYAPTDGVVVHANKYSSRGGNAEFVVEAGAQVRERQAIIELPDPTRMQVRCKVNESRITLLKKGMPAKIRLDALPDVVLKGRVTKVNRYAEPGSWFSSSVKEYATTIEIIDPPEVIRTGMTTAVEIFIQQIPEATQVPIQGLYEHGGNMYSLVQTGPMEFETRKVEVGAINDTMGHILSGLEPGEQVILNLREHLNLLDLPEIIAEDNSEMRDIRETAPTDTEDASDTEASPDGKPGAGPPGGGRPGGRKPGAGKPGGNRGAAGNAERPNRSRPNQQSATETTVDGVAALDSASQEPTAILEADTTASLSEVTDTPPVAS